MGDGRRMSSLDNDTNRSARKYNDRLGIKRNTKRSLHFGQRGLLLIAVEALQPPLFLFAVPHPLRFSPRDEN